VADTPSASTETDKLPTAMLMASMFIASPVLRQSVIRAPDGRDGGRSWIGGRLNLVFMCRPTRPSERVVVDRADVGDQSPQGNGGGLRRSGGEALVSVVQAAYLGSRHDLAHGRRVRTLSLNAQRTSARSSPPATTWARLIRQRG
jgi:hypothetical protein